MTYFDISRCEILREMTVKANTEGLMFGEVNVGKDLMNRLISSTLLLGDLSGQRKGQHSSTSKDLIASGLCSFIRNGVDNQWNRSRGDLLHSRDQIAGGQVSI